MAKKFRYFKNNKGTLFVDPKSKLKVTNNNITKIEAKAFERSETAKKALGHAILEVEEEDYNAWLASQGVKPSPAPASEPEDEDEDEDEPIELPEDLTKANKDELLAWVKQNEADIDEDDLKGIEKKTKAEIISIIESYKD